MHDAQKHSQTTLHPSVVVTLTLLFALKGVGHRAFFRWLKRDYLPLFPRLPHRTRLVRLFNKHRMWIERFMAEPTLLSVIDAYGIELIHPRREGRSAQHGSSHPAGSSILDSPRSATSPCHGGALRFRDELCGLTSTLEVPGTWFSGESARETMRLDQFQNWSSLPVRCLYSSPETPELPRNSFARRANPAWGERIASKNDERLLRAITG